MESGLDIASFVDSVLAAPNARREARESFVAADTPIGGPELTDPFTRMFSTRTGQFAASIVGNETRTLAILSGLAAEALAGAVTRAGDRLGPDGLSEDVSVLLLNRPEGSASPPAVLMLDPHLPDDFAARRFDWGARHAAVATAAMGTLEIAAAPDLGANAPGRREVARALLEGGPPALGEVLWIVRPEGIVARHPEMELVGCPSPALEVGCTAPGKPVESSSVGLFCRDADGVVGITACHHGTGPAGTPVTVGGLPSVVTLADAIQDIVFVPLPHGYAMPNSARGLNGPRSDRPPYQGEQVHFDGRTTGHKTTVVNSHSPGLLWIDALSQNKVQTPAAVNKGDSGSALVDDDDHVLGFAFRRTRTGQPLEFAEWIWAANALAALGLAPI